MWNYNKSIGIMQKLIVALAFAAYGVLLFSEQGDEILKPEILELISSSSIILNICARVPQIFTTCSTGSTGALAFFTVFLQFAGSGARLGTVFAESDDPMFRLQYVIGFGLNCIIVTQFFIFGSGPAEKKDKKD